MAPRRGTRLEEVLYSDDEDLERGGAETSYRNPLAAGAVQAQPRRRSVLPLPDSVRGMSALQKQCHDAAFNLWTQGGVVLLLLADVSLLVASLAHADADDGDMDPTETALNTTSLVILSLLAAEVLLRLFALGPRAFLSSGWNCADLLATLASFALAIVEEGELSHWARAARAPLLAGKALTRLCLAVARAHSAGASIPVALRHAISANKQRFVDTDAGFDLDLSYITPQIIAMSVPATGAMGTYRNPIDQVARALNERHESSYKVFNFCPELPYPTWPFEHRVVRYDVQDHAPPPLAELVGFVKLADEWLRAGGDAAEAARRVAAVHCKGGKGRTGCAIAALQLYRGEVHTPEAAMEAFQRARTDPRRKGKMQGVETPSQQRYIRMFADYLAQRAGEVGAKLGAGGWAALAAESRTSLPPPHEQTVHLMRLVATGLVAQPGGSWLMARVSTPQGRTLAESPIVQVAMGDAALPLAPVEENDSSAEAEGSLSPATPKSGAARGVDVDGDVRLTVYTVAGAQGPRPPPLSPSSARLDAPGGSVGADVAIIAGEEKGVACLAYVHTDFLGKSGPKVMPRMELDKACRGKIKVMGPSAALEIHFTPVRRSEQGRRSVSDAMAMSGSATKAAAAAAESKPGADAGDNTRQ